MPVIVMYDLMPVLFPAWCKCCMTCCMLDASAVWLLIDASSVTCLMQMLYYLLHAWVQCYTTCSWCQCCLMLDASAVWLLVDASSVSCLMQMLYHLLHAWVQCCTTCSWCQCCFMLDASAVWLLVDANAWYQSLLMQPILRWHSICCNEYITCCILDASIVDASNTLVTLLVWCQCCMTCSCMLIDGLWWCFHLPSDYTKCW